MYSDIILLQDWHFYFSNTLTIIVHVIELSMSFGNFKSGKNPENICKYISKIA